MQKATILPRETLTVNSAQTVARIYILKPISAANVEQISIK